MDTRLLKTQFHVYNCVLLYKKNNCISIIISSFLLQSEHVEIWFNIYFKPLFYTMLPNFKTFTGNLNTYVRYE